jgi:hypothetical protein
VSKVVLAPVIDPFRERQVPDVAGRFREAQDRHQRAAGLMWLGALAQFTGHEIRLLHDLGFLCQHDHDLLRQVRAARR